MPKGVSIARLKAIYQRQRDPHWDSSYVPGILATPQEAPSISHAFILTPQKLAGRESHFLSTAERDAALLGLYHPAVVGLQEQRMLSPEPTVHPLWTYPAIDRTTLPALKGVIDTADRLDLLEYLPKIYAPDPENPKGRMPLVYPWCGDLLWAVTQPNEQIACINWTVKGKHQDFSRPVTSRYGKPRAPGTYRSILARHEIEAAYYADGAIRTIAIAGGDINAHVSANLRQLFLHHRRPLGLSSEQRTEILEKYKAAQQQGIPPAEVITVFAERGRYSVEQCRTLFFQAIWNRELRVDLFSPILINRPMRPETQDAIEAYRDWFQGLQ